MHNVRKRLLSLLSESVLWTLLCAGLFVVIFPFDERLIRALVPFHSEALNTLSKGVTEYGIYVALLGLYTRMMWQWILHRRSRFMACNISILLAVFVGFILKHYFGVLRPFMQFPDLEPIVHAGFYSFPSNHTTLVFAALVPLLRLSWKWGIVWAFFALLTGFFRVYQYVHFPSDIIGGIFIGGLSGIIISHSVVVEGFVHFWRSREFRRQFAHFWFGIGGLIVYWVLRDLTVPFLSGVLIAGFGVSWLSLRYKLPIIYRCLDIFERKQDLNEFPGRGPLWFLLGIILTFALFPWPVAFASILILSAGDSFNHFFNRQPHHTPLPWNKNKNWYGLWFGTFMGALFACFFAPFWMVFIASLVSITLESFPIRIWHLYLNDNVFVPLVSGGILMLLL